MIGKGGVRQLSDLKRALAARLKSVVRPAKAAFTTKPQPVCFDAAWYLEQYPEVAGLGMLPWVHYDRIGAKKGYNPCEFFWTNWYVERYPDIAQAGINPLLHYEMFGAREGRMPSPRFDGVWYATSYCISLKDTNPLAHFMTTGRAKGYQPSEEIALAAFKRGDGGFNANHLLHASLDSKFERLGGSAYYEGRLTDGRSYAAEHGIDLARFVHVDAVASAMTSEGAYCLPPYLAEFRNVIVIPGSTLLITEDGIIGDETSAARSIVPALTQHKLWDRAWVKDDRIAIRYDVEISPRIPAGIHLFKEHEQNYFHFVCELMPKLYSLERSGISCDIPLLVCDDLNPRLYEIIDILKDKSRKIIKLRRNVPYVVERLTYLSDLANVTDVYNAKPSLRHTFLPEQVLAEMSESLIGATVTRRDGGRRIYLPRDSKRRAILNEGELVEAMVRDGYETPNLESLTFPAQVELFANADIVIGGTGAGFTNLLWCRPGTKAIILYSNHPYNNTTFWDRIAKVRGVDITYIEGARSGNVQGIYSMHDDFNIDLSDLRRAIP